MKKVTTASGFSCEVDENALNDMELFDALVALDGGDMSVLPTVVSKIMGPSKKALYDHVRLESGIVPIDGVIPEVLGVIQALGRKNS